MVKYTPDGRPIEPAIPLLERLTTAGLIVLTVLALAAIAGVSYLIDRRHPGHEPPAAEARSDDR